MSEYYLKNRDRIIDYNKEYYRKHIDEKKIYNKQYNELHRHERFLRNQLKQMATSKGEKRKYVRKEPVVLIPYSLNNLVKFTF